MDNDNANYDMLDTMIANSKKAKSWTAFWISILCVLGAVVIWMAYTVVEKNKIIAQTNTDLVTKSRIIDSLTENCNDAKSEIINEYDSVIVQTQQALNIVNAKGSHRNTSKWTIDEKKKLEEANISLTRIKADINTVKAQIKKESTRIFLQYNNAENADKTNKLAAYIKRKSDYVVAPPEYVNQPFSTLIKFYNYRNSDEERTLIKLISSLFKIDPKSIRVTYQKNPDIKNTVEIWINTKTISINTQQMQKKN